LICTWAVLLAGTITSAAQSGTAATNAVCNWNGPVDAKACFGAKGDGVTSDVAAIQSWLTYLSAGNRRGLLPPGIYNVSNYSGLSTQVIEGVKGYILALQNAPNVTIEGYGATLVQKNAGSNAVTLGVYNSPNFQMYGVTFDGQNVYTSSSRLVYMQQLVHIINTDGFVIDSCRFRHSFGNGLLVTHQYSNNATARVAGEDAGRITNSLFEQVNTAIETAYHGASQLEIVGNQFRNNTLSSVKLSSGPQVISATTGYNTALTNVLIANNIIKYDSQYVNPLNSAGTSANTYHAGFDSASNMKQISYVGNTVDFDGLGPAGTIGLKVNWNNGDLQPASDGNLAPEKITIANNQILNLPTGSFGIRITPTARNLLVTGNRIASAHTGIIVQTLGQGIGSWNGKSTWQFDGNQFVDNDQADINITGLTASRVSVKNNTFSLQTVSSMLQALYIDNTSIIGELMMANNQSDKSLVSAAQHSRVAVMGNVLSPQSGTSCLYVDNPTMATGSTLIHEGNFCNGGTRSYFAHFANGTSAGNTMYGQTDSGAALQFNTIADLYLNRDQVISPTGKSISLASTRAHGSVVGPYASFSSLAMASGSTAERTDGAGTTDGFYVMEKSGWKPVTTR
jgi:hypothetical protein